MKICFVAPNVYPFFFHGENTGKIGGAEFQQRLIGAALAARGIDVSFVSLDVGQKEIIEQENISFIRAYKEGGGLPGLRFFYPRLTQLWKALKKADADIYYVRCAGFLPGVLALFCSIYEKKFVFAGAHDTDFEPGNELVCLVRDRLLYRFGLRRAAKIFVQSYHQKKTLRLNYDLEGLVLRNFYKPETNCLEVRSARHILWVASIKSWKQPLAFVRLARSLPEQKFVMVGGVVSGEEELFATVKKESSKINNLVFKGFQPVDEVEILFDECDVFVNTSTHEGFPNTFLQAWGRGVPVLSFIDPDGVIRKYGLGKSVDDELRLSTELGELLTEREKYPKNIVKYFLEEHSDKQIDKYISVFSQLLQKG